MNRLHDIALSMDEAYDAFDVWFIDMTDGFENLMPGSKAMLQAAEMSKERITIQEILSRSDATLATIVSRELCSVLKKKAIGQARAQLKALSENEWLEARRIIRTNLCCKDGQRLQEEPDTLTVSYQSG